MSVIVEDAQRVAERLPLQELGSVLVTGAGGMLGRYLVECLLAAGVEVHALARRPVEYSKPVRMIVGDVCTAPLPVVEHIIHAASPAHPDAFVADPVGVIRANVTGTMRLLEHVRNYGAEHLTLVSSSEALTDADSSEVRSAYPVAKRMAENLCTVYAAQHEVSSSVVRLAHTYGPGFGPADSRVWAQFFRAAAAGQDIEVHSTKTRTWLYVADAAEGVLSSALSGAPTTTCAGPTASILGFAGEVAAAAGVGVRLTGGDHAGWATEQPTVDPGPWAVGIREGVARTLRWLKEQQ